MLGRSYIESTLTAAHEGGVRLMVHIGDPQFGSDPTITRQLLPLLRPGDLLTHLFTGKPGKAIDDANRVLPELVDAKERGVLFDPAHGRWNLSFEVAKRLLDQDIAPRQHQHRHHQARPRHREVDDPHDGQVPSIGILAPGRGPHEHTGPRPHDRTGGGARLPRRGHDRRRDDSGRRPRQVRCVDSEGATLIGEQVLRPVLTFKGGEQHNVDYGPFPWGWLPDTGE